MPLHNDCFALAVQVSDPRKMGHPLLCTSSTRLQAEVPVGPACWHCCSVHQQTHHTARGVVLRNYSQSIQASVLLRSLLRLRHSLVLVLWCAMFWEYFGWVILVVLARALLHQRRPKGAILFTQHLKRLHGLCCLTVLILLCLSGIQIHDRRRDLYF